MKTIERLDFPLRVYFRDGECYHGSAVIVFTHGAPAYVRASSPFVVYPWENIKHIIRVADEDQAPGRIAALEAEVVRLTTSHREKRLALRAALGLRDDEATDNLTSELCDRVAYLKRTHDAACRDLASVTEQRDVLKRQLEELRAEMQEGDSVKRVLQRQVDRLRHEPVPSQPNQVGPGGPIWVRVVDTTSKHFGLVGVINGIEYSSRDGREMWSVDLGHTGVSHQDASMFAIVSTGRRPSPIPTFEEQVKSYHENNPPSEPNPDNRDSYRSTALRAGAKDCTLFIGPKPTDLTFVVEMREGSRVFDVVAALEHEHGLAPEAYRIREVRTPTT